MQTQIICQETIKLPLDVAVGWGAEKVRGKKTRVRRCGGQKNGVGKEGIYVTEC